MTVHDCHFGESSTILDVGDGTQNSVLSASGHTFRYRAQQQIDLPQGIEIT